MLGPINFEGLFASSRINDGTNVLEALDWVICGGESGLRAADAPRLGPHAARPAVLAPTEN